MLSQEELPNFTITCWIAASRTAETHQQERAADLYQVRGAEPIYMETSLAWLLSSIRGMLMQLEISRANKRQDHASDAAIALWEA